MIGYYTDNVISQSVMKAFSRSGVMVNHIADFKSPPDYPTPIFYGLLRGTGRAMINCSFAKYDFYYLDNGYFDALYINEKKQKDLNGKYRVVKNELIEPMDIQPKNTSSGSPRLMLVPPSPYTAFMYDTTPEDWLRDWAREFASLGIEYGIREKNNSGTFAQDVEDFDAVFAFNSMAIMKAVEMGKAVYTTHGCIRNAALLYKQTVPYYSLDELKKFYESKQFTLEQIADLGVKCLN